MLRITEIEAANEILTLRLEGRVMGQWAEEIRKECRNGLATHKKIILDMSGVYFMDEVGTKTIKALSKDYGLVEITGCSLFLSELLDGKSYEEDD